jgi:isoquinoline 1-oxidoreductase beta subunit
MGVACVSSQERATASWTACVAHVAVAPSGEVKVKKLTVATDVGTQVHPDNIRAQVEGAALWGLSLAMYEKATLKDGGIEQTNFDTYTPLRVSQVPEVAISVIANGEKATGVGEPAVTVVAPALGNAIFNACGARVRSLPITAEAVKASMKAQKSIASSMTTIRRRFPPADFFMATSSAAVVSSAAPSTSLRAQRSNPFFLSAVRWIASLRSQ